MNAKKIVTAGLALVMVAGISVAGTLAYLTSTADKVTNTFTVGEGVAISLDELDVDNSTPDKDRDTANRYELAPGGVYVKDPTVHVEGESCLVFVKVVNNLTTTEEMTTGDSYKDAEGETQEYKTIAEQMTENGWYPVAGEENVYVYGTSATAPTAVEKGTNLVVFGYFGIDSGLDNDAYKGLDNKTIEVEAFAIQADKMDLATAISQLPQDWAKD